MTAGLLSSPLSTPPTWSAIWPIDFPAKTSGWALASPTVSGSSGHCGVNATYPAFSNSLIQRSQLLGSSHRPCTNATGCFPDVFARWTCFVSAALMVTVASVLVPLTQSPPPPHRRLRTATRCATRWAAGTSRLLVTAVLRVPGRRLDERPRDVSRRQLEGIGDDSGVGADSVEHLARRLAGIAQRIPAG